MTTSVGVEDLQLEYQSKSKQPPAQKANKYDTRMTEGVPPAARGGGKAGDRGGDRGGVGRSRRGGGACV